MLRTWSNSFRGVNPHVTNRYTCAYRFVLKPVYLNDLFSTGAIGLTNCRDIRQIAENAGTHQAHCIQYSNSASNEPFAQVRNCGRVQNRLTYLKGRTGLRKHKRTLRLIVLFRTIFSAIIFPVAKPDICLSDCTKIVCSNNLIVPSAPKNWFDLQAVVDGSQVIPNSIIDECLKISLTLCAPRSKIGNPPGRPSRCMAPLFFAAVAGSLALGCRL